MKTLILYKTKKGSTRDYAEYLYCKIEGSELYNLDTFIPKFIHDFDLVILGTATYAGQLLGNDFLIKNWELLKSKKVFYFSVGMLDPESPESKKSYETIPEHIRKQITYIKVPGRIENDRLNLLQKLLVKIVKAPIIDKVDMQKIDPAIKFAKL